MKLMIFINGDDPEMREAQAMADEILAEGYDVEVFDWETDEAADAARLYDLYSTPAFVITGPEGRVIEQWQGTQLPLTSEIKHLM
jgi:hypothetical protein